MTENKQDQEINYMITQEGCGACESAQQIEPIKKAIEEGRIKVTPLETQEGLELANKHQIRATPTIINKKGDFEQKCLISKDGSKMYCGEKHTEKEI